MYICTSILSQKSDFPLLRKWTFLHWTVFYKYPVLLFKFYFNADIFLLVLFCKKLLRVGKHYCFRKERVLVKIESTFSPSKLRCKSINLNDHCKVGGVRPWFPGSIVYLYTLQMGMNLRIVYLFNEYFLIYSNPAKLRKAEWNPSKIKEHDSHSRQWLGQCLGQKGRRDECWCISGAKHDNVYVAVYLGFFF